MTLRYKRTFWGWLAGEPAQVTKTLGRADTSPLYKGPREPNDCAWCSIEWFEHTVSAHRVQLLKRALMRRAVEGGDTSAWAALKLLQQAESAR